MPRNVRRTLAALAVSTAALAGGGQAAFAACDAPAQAYNQYADRIDAIFSDGFESGDVSRVRQATQSLQAQIDGYTATDDLWKWRREAVQALIVGMGTEVVVFARLQQAVDRINDLREPGCN